MFECALCVLINFCKSKHDINQHFPLKGGIRCETTHVLDRRVFPKKAKASSQQGRHISGEEIGHAQRRGLWNQPTCPEEDDIKCGLGAVLIL